MPFNISFSEDLHFTTALYMITATIHQRQQEAAPSRVLSH